MAYNLEDVQKKKQAEVEKLTGTGPVDAAAENGEVYIGADQKQHIAKPGESAPNSASIEAPRGEVVEGEGQPNSPDAPPTDGPVVKGKKADDKKTAKKGK